MFRILKNQKGTVLVFAILLTLVLMLGTYLLFAVTHFGVAVQKDKRKKFLEDVLTYRIFQEAFANVGLDYTSNVEPLASNSGSTLDGVSYTIDINNSRIQDLESSEYYVIPESGYTQSFIDYYVDIDSSISNKYAHVRVPSSTSSSLNHDINKSIASLNIPAINFSRLIQSQLNSGSGVLDDEKVGYIGDVRIDNSGSTPQLIFTKIESGSSIDHAPIDIPLTNSSDLALSQGWELVDGSWEVSIGVYNSSNTEGCVIQAPLSGFLTDASQFTCESFGDGIVPGAKYPNPISPIVYNLCIELNSYSIGDICQEDGILFTPSQSGTRAFPFTRDRRGWRVYYPNSTWVAPFTQGVRYSVGDLVVYDGMLFKSVADNLSSDVFDSYNWDIQDVYLWDNRVRYSTGDVAIYQGNFYRARRNSVNSTPSSGVTNSRWEFIGATYEGKGVSEYGAPYNIVFPLDYGYRKENPTQDELNCSGQYPAIDTNVYSQCIEGNSYAIGDRCYENNMLFEARSSTSSSPFNNKSSWKIYVPDINWVIPFSNNYGYPETTRVIYNGRRFMNSSPVSNGITPYESYTWLIDGVYEWNGSIRYQIGDIVIRDGDFYRSLRRQRNNRDPATTPARWENLGDTYNGQTVQEVKDVCGAASIPITLGGNLFLDGGGNYLTLELLDLPAGFNLYDGISGDYTNVSYRLSGSLFDATNLIYTTDQNGWVANYSPSSDGETLVRPWSGGGDNASVFLSIAGMTPGDYSLNVNFEYTSDGLDYQGLGSYNVTV